MFLLPPELYVLLSSMLPVGELRAGIPIGLLMGISKEAAFFWAELGNILAIAVVLKILEPLSGWLMKKSRWCEKKFTKLFEHTRTKHSGKMEKMGEVFLVFIAAIPIPGTGGWTAALMAFLFGVPYMRALLLILGGNIICGLLIIFGITGAEQFMNVLSK